MGNSVLQAQGWANTRDIVNALVLFSFLWKALGVRKVWWAVQERPAGADYPLHSPEPPTNAGGREQGVSEELQCSLLYSCDDIPAPICSIRPGLPSLKCCVSEDGEGRKALMASSNCSKFKRKLILLSARAHVSVIPREGGKSWESPSLVEAFP